LLVLLIFVVRDFSVLLDKVHIGLLLQEDDILRPKDLILDFFPLLFGLIIKRVENEDIEFIFWVDFVHEADVMCDLVFFFDEIEFWDNTRMIFELGLPDCEEIFYAVLDSLVDFAFVEDAFESLEDGCDALRGEV
jgi:hypothetical protein